MQCFDRIRFAAPDTEDRTGRPESPKNRFGRAPTIDAAAAAATTTTTTTTTAAAAQVHGQRQHRRGAGGDRGRGGRRRRRRLLRTGSRLCRRRPGEARGCGDRGPELEGGKAAAGGSQHASVPEIRPQVFAVRGMSKMGPGLGRAMDERNRVERLDFGWRKKEFIHPVATSRVLHSHGRLGLLGKWTLVLMFVVVVGAWARLVTVLSIPPPPPSAANVFFGDRSMDSRRNIS
mmetsp:Transcript_14895/g.33590  ORF Transcript_14895/g.33590 Transcript_14895/m.33590 type:complete len:232 (-) Transcript_14895:121-816(-)